MQIENTATGRIHSLGQPHTKQIHNFDTLLQMKQQRMLRQSHILRQPMSTASDTESEQENLQKTYDRLSQSIKTGEYGLAQSAVLQLTKLLRESDSPITEGYCIQAVKSIVHYFNKLARKLQDEQQQQISVEEEPQTQYLMLQVLSVVSQLINDLTHRNFKFPFTRSFLQNVFMVSAQLIGVSSRRRQILRIISVILSALASHTKKLQEFEMFPRYRQTILENYRFAEDPATFNRLNRALKVVAMLAPLSLMEVKKYKLLETVARFTNSKSCSDVLGKFNLSKFVEKAVVVDPNLMGHMGGASYT